MSATQSLRRGDLVEVRPAAEILATLDENGCLEALPFMPEMLPYLGSRLTVSRRVEKICDTIARTGSRRMHNVVFLENLRCDGSAHGGCEAGCRLYWKEAWLRRVDAADEVTPDQGDEAVAVLTELTRRAVRRPRVLDGEETETFRCQATEAFAATPERLRTRDPRHYVRELTVRNVGFWTWVRVMMRAAWTEIAARIHLYDDVPLRNTKQRVEPEPLELKPGDWVQVRSKEEIAPTLDSRGYTRGLSFAWEMVPFCGGTYRVQRRVKRIINEKSGRMIDLASDCIILEDVVCTGDCSLGRWFCGREIYAFWREAWLRRVDPPTHPGLRLRSPTEL